MTNNTNELSFFMRQHIVMVQGIVLAIVAIFMFTGVTVPLFSRARESREVLQSKVQVSKELADQVVFLTNLDKTVLKQRIEILNAALPPSKDVLLFLNTIDGLSRELGLSLKGIQLSPGEIASASADVVPLKNDAIGMHSLDTQLTIGGSQENIYSFLKAVEMTAPLMRVKDVKVSRVGEESFSLNVMLSMLYADPAQPGGLKGKTVLFSDEEEAMLKQISQLKTYSVAPSDPSLTVPTGKSDLFLQYKISEELSE